MSDQGNPAQEQQNQPREYQYKIADYRDFTLEALFKNGRVKAEVVIAPGYKVTFQSLLTSEIHEIDGKMKINPDSSIRDYNNRTATKQLAYALVAVNGQPSDKSVEEREGWLLAQSAILHDRILSAYLEFNEQANELFKATGDKKEDNVLKKS